MNFISFIRELENQEDDGLNSFIDVAVNDTDFPPTSDPVELSEYLYLLLNPDQTGAFQKMLMIYQQAIPNNELPSKYKDDPMSFLNILNHVVELQNDDPKYRWG